MPSRSDVLRLDRAQSQISSAASRDLRTVVRALDLSSPTSSRDALLEAYPAIAMQYGDVSATVAAEWYEDTRQRARGGTFAAQLAALPVIERAEQSVRWAADALFTDTPWNIESLLGGSLERMLGDSSRDTVTENVNRDNAAVGWHRIARAIGCDFCVMLSQRGAVYKKQTATFASHDNCHCKAAPSWDPSAPEVEAMAYEASDRMEAVRRRASNPDLSPADRARAQAVLDRHRKRTREWMDANEWRLDDMRAELT